MVVSRSGSLYLPFLSTMQASLKKMVRSEIESENWQGMMGTEERNLEVVLKL